MLQRVIKTENPCCYPEKMLLKSEIKHEIHVENVILPNKPLSNFGLEDAVKILKIQTFRGDFSE